MATVGWAVFLLLQVILVGRWWPWFFLESVPPLAMIVVPLLLLALVPLARRIRWHLSVALVVLLLAGIQVGGYGPAWTSTAGAGPRAVTIKVFAWNTSYWDQNNDADAFYAYLRQQNADVYLLQEYLNRFGQPFRIDDSTRIHAEFPGYEMSVDGDLLTLSRLPIVATFHHPVPGDGFEWYKQVDKTQRTDIRVGGRTVSFYSVHLPVPFRADDSPFTGSFYQAFAQQEARRGSDLGKLRAMLADNTNPIVLAGDFNSPWMNVSLHGTGTRVYNPTGVGRSWPIAQISMPRLWRLDWLFTTGDLTIPDYRFGGGAQAFSDHAPQVFHVAVPDAQK